MTHFWSELTFLATVNKLTSVNALSSNEQLGSFLKPVRVTEGNLGKGSTSARIVNDVLLEWRRTLEQDTAFATGSVEIKELGKLEITTTEVILRRMLPFSQRNLDSS